MLLCLRGRDGEFKFAVAALGTRSRRERGAPTLSCAATASCSARGDRVLVGTRTALAAASMRLRKAVRGQNAAARRLRSRLRE